ncbi:MAG TPA: hypothetical protein PKL26_02250 [Methanolinea sp.]|nr:hypothetical protein [Methanolinea sp.]
MIFEVIVRKSAHVYLSGLPEKSRRIVKSALYSLGENPFPGTGGDKEKLVLREGLTIYRIHIGHRYTAFYAIDTEHGIVRVHEILTIEQAHKRYGRL